MMNRALKSVLYQFLLMIVFFNFLHAQPTISAINGMNANDISFRFGVVGTVGDSIQKPHNGIDFHVEIGTPVLAAADGVIIFAKKTGKHYGKYIKVRHDDTFETFYAHLSRIIVEEGDKVKKGEIIGYVGQSGLATKPNLHYEVRMNGEQVDPADYIPTSGGLEK